MMGPIGCVAAVTYRCNARCGMCGIWQLDSRAAEELEPDAYRWLPRSLRSVNVSGGEPFLRDDLVEIVATIHRSCPRARVVISTNGLMPERIEKMVSRMRDVAIRVSVDAVGERHDEIRGVDGAFEKAMDTTRRLIAGNVEDLGLAATLTQSNVGEITRVRDLAQALGVEFVATAAHSSPIFFGAHGNEEPRSAGAAEEIAGIMRDRLRSRRPRDWAKAYYMRGLIDHVRGRPRRLACRAGIDFFFLDPWGGVYPCNILDVSMGPLSEGSFSELSKRSADRVRPAVHACRSQCWMVCTVAPPMRRRPLGPIGWIAGAKLFGRDTRVGR
jgi:MoaA/NifB/PqqE/SkfB family radical SAM enzyme